MSTTPTDSEQSTSQDGVRLSPRSVIAFCVVLLGLIIAYLLFSNVLFGINRPLASVDRLWQIGLVVLMAGIFPLSAIAFGWLEVPRIVEQVRRDCLLLGADLPRDRTGDAVGDRWSVSSYLLHYLPAVIATLIGIALLARRPDEYLNVNTLQAMRFGFLGAYIYCINLLYRRYTTLDLQPHVYSYCAVGLIAGMVFNYVAFQAISDIASFNEQVVVREPAGDGSVPQTEAADRDDSAGPSVSDSPASNDADARLSAARTDRPFTGVSAAIAAILAFSLGYFPNLAIRWFRRLSHAAIHEGVRRSEALPLSLIDGISELHETRLRDEGIDNVQNLATANIRDLVVKTPFSAQEIVEWIDQAVLYLYLDPTEIASFRRAGARCVTDFADLWRGYCVRYRVENGAFVRKPVVDNGTPGSFDTRRKALAQHLQTTEERLDALYTATRRGPNMHFVRAYWTNVQDMAARARETLVNEICGHIACSLRSSERDGATVTPADMLKQVARALLDEAQTFSGNGAPDLTAHSLFGQAWLNRFVGNVRQAQKLYQQCIKDFPDDPTAFNDYAWMILQTLRDPSLYEQAATYARSAVQMARASDAKNALPGYLDTLALAQIRLKQPGEAITTLNEAIKLWRETNHADQPKFLETLLSAAEQFHSQGKLVQSLRELDRVIDAGYADDLTEGKARSLIPKVTAAVIATAQTLGAKQKKKEANEMLRSVVDSSNAPAADKERAKSMLTA